MAVLPDKSVALYITEYVPVAAVFTLLKVVEAVITPSTVSVAVTPSSTYEAPTNKLMVDEPIKDIAGAVVSLITTSEVAVATLLAASVAVQRTVVVPKAKDAGLYVRTGATPELSVVVATVKTGVVVAPVASNT